MRQVDVKTSTIKILFGLTGFCKTDDTEHISESGKNQYVDVRKPMV